MNAEHDQQGRYGSLEPIGPAYAPPASEPAGALSSAPDRPGAEARSLAVSDGRQTIDSIFFYEGRLRVSDKDPAEAMLADRHETSRLDLEDVIEQVRERWELYRRHVDELEEAKVDATNAERTWFDHLTSGKLHPSETLQSRLEALEQQKREERLSLWRDVSRLRRSLPEAAQRYLMAQRRMKILEDAGGDAF